MNCSLADQKSNSSEPWAETADRRIGYLAACGCAGLLIAKLVLIWRLNINWDEFHFLSDVYALQRGELTATFLGAYTHLFTWLTWTGENEINQIFAARLVMFACLIGTCWGVWQLACRWTSRGVALVAPLCYLSMLSVVVHGTSFRYDPMLAFSSVVVLLLLSRTSSSQWVMAGVCMGIATVISLKAVLLLPVAGALVCADFARTPRPYQRLFRDTLQFFLAATITAGVLFWLHSFSVAPTETSAALADRYVRQTLVEIPLFPQANVLRREFGADPVTWILLGSGFIVSLIYPGYRAAAACALSLIPVVFYRNSFPYYYIVMLAPACVLVAVLVDFTHRHIQPRVSHFVTLGLSAAVIVALAGQGARHAYDFRFDDVTNRQRSVVDAVHQIFPSPVPYIDHGGMISSFPKVNLFMSSWGIQRYVAGGRSFMPDAIRLHRPPFLLANRPILQPEHPLFGSLLPEDQQLINEFYLPYWGPVRVAGASTTLQGGKEAIVRLPFPGKYRVETTEPIAIDATERRDGDVIDVGFSGKISARALSPSSEGTQIRLLWAAARNPPATPPPYQLIFIGL